MKEKVIVSWSGGKDSALSLHEILKANSYEVLELLTTVTADYDRISTHGVRRVLLEHQARSLGFPLEVMLIPKGIADKGYEDALRRVLAKHLHRGVSTVIFGDIFLEDVRKYREQLLSKMGMKGVFPLWNRNTRELAHTFVDLGFKAVITVVDSTLLGRDFVGREFDEKFLSDLPASVDPCGENGEFHTFVYDGPIFHQTVKFTKGETVLRESRFHYRDLIPSQSVPTWKLYKEGV
jgi:uncharacterized protein (TIGR00290 family)